MLGIEGMAATVSLLRLAAADVAAVGAKTQIERTAAPLAGLPARLRGLLRSVRADGAL